MEFSICYIFYIREKNKSLRIAQKSFLDNKKNHERIFHMLVGGCQPAYGKFHMFCRFFFESFAQYKKMLKQAENGLQSRSDCHGLSWMNFMDDYHV